MRIITSAERRTVTTPNGTMTTLASPTLCGASSSMWWVRMAPGAAGPVHAFANEVVWAITDGHAEVTCGDDSQVLAAGDTVVLPGGVMRQFVAGPQGFSAVASTVAPGTVQRADTGESAVPPWVA